MNNIKKRILFVLRVASFGGSAISMINLLSIYKEMGTEFDLFLMDHNGILTEEAAKYANLLPQNMKLVSSITDRKNLRSPLQFLYRIEFIIANKLFGRKKALSKLYKKCAKKLSGKYDHVIAYQESSTTEFARYIVAPKKTTWLHMDFDVYSKETQQYSIHEIYDKFDHIVCVTDASVKSVKQRMRRDESTVHLIRNTLPTSLIKERSKAPIKTSELKSKDFLFVSVGRLSPEKAYDRIPRVARMLLDKGFSFDWYIIGEGASHQTIGEEIEIQKVAECVHLLGARMNPYPYISMADCLVITSKYEAQPMVANESLILDTPVISTEFSSVREVICENVNGVIVLQSSNDLASALNRFMTDELHRESLKRGASDFVYSNEREIISINSLLN